MNVRTKSSPPRVGIASAFTNEGHIDEIIVTFHDSIVKESVLISTLQIEVRNTWIDMELAFALGSVVTDAAYTTFREPRNAQERHRGYAIA